VLLVALSLLTLHFDACNATGNSSGRSHENPPAAGVLTGNFTDAGARIFAHVNHTRYFHALPLALTFTTRSTIFDVGTSSK